MTEERAIEKVDSEGDTTAAQHIALSFSAPSMDGVDQSNDSAPMLVCFLLPPSLLSTG